MATIFKLIFLYEKSSIVSDKVFVLNRQHTIIYHKQLGDTFMHQLVLQCSPIWPSLNITWQTLSVYWLIWLCLWGYIASALTQWHLYKMATALLMTFSDASYWYKNMSFWIEFRFSVFDYGPNDNKIIISSGNWCNSQIPQCTCSISHNAPFRTECAHFCSEWSIVGFGTHAFSDLWNRSIECCGLLSVVMQQIITWNCEHRKFTDACMCQQG